LPIEQVAVLANRPVCQAMGLQSAGSMHVRVLLSYGYGIMTQHHQHRRTATLASLAAELGVSRTTVSNAYNRPDQLSPQLRTRVLEAAKRLGYPGPDPLARSLRTRRAGAIGLLLTEALSYAFRDPGAVGFLEGLSLACEQHRVGLLLVPVGTGSTDDPSAVFRAGVDGFCVYSLPDRNDFLAAALERGMPTVVVDEPVDLPGVDYVGVNDFAATAALGRHLTGLGHRHLGVITTKLMLDGYFGFVGPDRRRASAYAVVRARLAGLADAVTDIGTRVENLPVYECRDHTDAAGEAAAHALLDQHPEITAIVALTDLLAFGVLRAAAARGLAVPSDLSVVGYDDVQQAADARLTTVRQPLREKGRVAGSLLFDDSVESLPRRRILPTELIVRGTSGPPPL
jgi:DNA-binding LacI/PurR family transcriptional regulator